MIELYCRTASGSTGDEGASTWQAPRQPVPTGSGRSPPSRSGRRSGSATPRRSSTVPRASTFRDLDRRARRAARALIAHGVRPGDRVAIWAPNRWEWAVAALGALGAGAWLVPVNTRFKGAEAADVLERAGVRMLFTVGDFLGTDYPAALAPPRPTWPPAWRSCCSRGRNPPARPRGTSSSPPPTSSTTARSWPASPRWDPTTSPTSCSPRARPDGRRVCSSPMARPCARSTCGAGRSAFGRVTAT